MPSDSFIAGVALGGLIIALALVKLAVWLTLSAFRVVTDWFIREM